MRYAMTSVMSIRWPRVNTPFAIPSRVLLENVSGVQELIHDELVCAAGFELAKGLRATKGITEAT